MLFPSVLRAVPSVVLVGTAMLLGPAAFSQDYGDTPYVPTPQHVVDKMLEVARVGANDYVIDLGSGDGRMVITAAKKYGARGFGVDIDRTLVKRSNALAAKAGVAERAVFYQRDLYKTDLSRASVLTMYLLPEVNLMVRPKLLKQLKPGTRIVSHDYDLGEWEPDRALVLDAPDKPVGADFKSKIFYWVVPAVVSGAWRGQLTAAGKRRDVALEIDQMFQQISGTLTVAGQRVQIDDGKLSGTEVSFAAQVGEGAGAVRYRFSGRLVKQAIEGEVRVETGGEAQRLTWKATRTHAAAPAHAALKPPAPPAFQ